MKKLLSLILAIALVLSLIPAAFAADDPITVTYNFTATEQKGIPVRDGVTSMDKVEYLQITTVDGSIAAGEYGRLLVDYPSDEYSGGHWALLGSNFPVTVIDATSGNNSAFMQVRDDYMYMPAFGAGEYIAFKIKVPKTGMYQITGFTRSANDTKALNELDIYLASYSGALKDKLENPEVFGNSYGTRLYKGARYYGTRTGGLSLNQLELPNDSLMARVDVKASTAEGIFDEAVPQAIKELTAGEEYVFIVNAPAGARLWLQTLTLTEVLEEEDEPVELNGSVAFGAGADILVNGEPYTADNIKSFNPGTSVTVEVTDAENFAGWVRGTETSGVWVSGDAEYTFNIISPTYLTPIYTLQETDATHTVEFWDENGAYVDTVTAIDGKAVFPTADKYGLVGGEFDGWWLNATTELFEGADVAEGITRAVAKYNYGSFGAKVSNSNEEAKYWMRGEDVVAYGNSYDFYQWTGEEEITFGTEEIENKPLVVLDAESVDGAYMIEYDKGNASEVVEAGIIFGSDAEIVIGSTDGSKASSQRNDDHGQFCAKPNAGGNCDYVRGYLVYRGEENKLYVIYTNAIEI